MQQNDEWFKARLGKVTASRVSDVMAKTKTGYGAARGNYMMELLCQRLTGKFEEGFTSAAMERGIELEGKARDFYELVNEPVTQVGFVEHPTIKGFGASPDGLVGDKKCLEIKCPNTATHVEFIRTQKPAGKYIIQMQVQMMCTERDECDFVSFDDRLPIELSYACVTIPADKEMQKDIETEVVKFLKELDELEAELSTRVSK